MAIRIITTALPVAFVNGTYSTRLQIVDAATGNTSWSVTGLPSGLSYSASTGVISGSPGGITGELVGTYAITAEVDDGVDSDSLSVDLIIRPKESQRVAALVLDPRLETLLNLFDEQGITREYISAHFSRKPVSTILLRSPNVLVMDEQVHSASQVSYADLSVSPPDSPDTRSVKDVLDTLIGSTSLVQVESISDSADIYTGFSANTHSFRGLRDGTQTSVVLSANSNDVRVDHRQSSFFSSTISRLLPHIRIPGTWRCGHIDTSPDGPFSPTNTAFYGAHLYPYWTFSALNIKGFPHFGHTQIAGTSVQNPSHYRGYADGYPVARNAVIGRKLFFKATGLTKIVDPNTFIEFIFEPDIGSPPIYSPSPAADFRMICNSDPVGVFWTDDQYRPITVEGSISFTNYNSWSWEADFSIAGLNNQVIYSKHVFGRKDDANYSYQDGALLGIRYRIDVLPNLHIWDETYQGIGNELLWRFFEMGPTS